MTARPVKDLWVFALGAALSGCGNECPVQLPKLDNVAEVDLPLTVRDGCPGSVEGSTSRGAVQFSCGSGDDKCSCGVTGAAAVGDTVTFSAVYDTARVEGSFVIEQDDTPDDCTFDPTRVAFRVEPGDDGSAAKLVQAPVGSSLGGAGPQ